MVVSIHVHAVMTAWIGFFYAVDPLNTERKYSQTQELRK